MFQKLVSRNPDLAKLVERGYAVAFDSGCLIIRDLPYLDCDGALQTGAIVTKMVFVNDEEVRQEDHQVFFAGSHPHELNGTPIKNLGGGAATFALSERLDDVKVERSFSNKPVRTGRFDDFYSKIDSYVSIICGPAIERFGVSPLTFNVDKSDKPHPFFKHQDTLTSRAGLIDLNEKFHGQKIAIIGLGGTGSYLLDFAVRSPIPEIIGFDGDTFQVHNAYRAPGMVSKSEFGMPKANVFQRRYEQFRSGLDLRAEYVTSASEADFEGVTFAFVCVDSGTSRAEIFDLLIRLEIPFIDVGLGLRRKHGALVGMARTTFYPVKESAKMRDMGLAELSDDSDNLYRTNIQIAELNAANASLAMTRYKQHLGFYHSYEDVLHLLYNFGYLDITGEADLNAL